MAANERLPNLTRYTTPETLVAEAAAAVSCVADINMCVCLSISSLQEMGKRNGYGTHLQECFKYYISQQLLGKLLLCLPNGV